MRHAIRIATHMLVSGTCMLLFLKTFESLWELGVYSAVIMLLVAFLYILRSKIKSFWIFLGIHIALLIGGSYLILTLNAYKWYIAIWCFWILYSAILRLAPVAEYMDEPRGVYVVLLGIEYLGICILKGSMFTQYLNLISIALVFLLYLFYRNMDSMDAFILIGSFSNKIDEQGIRKLNYRLTLLYTGMLGVLLAIFSLFRMDGLWTTIMGWIRRLLRFLVSLIPVSEEMQSEEEVALENVMSNLFQEMAPEQELSAWKQLIGELVRGIIAFVIVAGIVAGIVYAAIYVYRHFYNRKNREEGDKVIESLSFGTDIAKQKKPGVFERFERSPARRIRKIYKKSLKRAGAKRILNLEYMSPEEQVQFLRKQGMSEEAIDEIKMLYEKARYSKDLATETEAERMRAIL